MVYPNPQIYPHLKALFVHVPKTAGTAIERALCEDPKRTVGGHTTALGYRRRFPDEFSSFFKFSVVRHPVSRFLSAWRYLRGMPINNALNNAEIHACGSFSVWMDSVHREPKKLDGIVHFLPASRFLCDEGGQVLVDRLFHYEAIDSDWTTICETLALPEHPLPRLNASRADLAMEELSGWEPEWISEVYSDDLRLGGYEASTDAGAWAAASGGAVNLWNNYVCDSRAGLCKSKDEGTKPRQ